MSNKAAPPQDTKSDTSHWIMIDGNPEPALFDTSYGVPTWHLLGDDVGIKVDGERARRHIVYLGPLTPPEFALEAKKEWEGRSTTS